ncbi:MAG: DUF342 domain-containing protein [Firmicutes bacterium]|nr:DUF342 domain-containing protein [Bacillota bacterium]
MVTEKLISIVDNRMFLNTEPVTKYPVVRPDKHITIYVDGKPRNAPVIVSNEEEIKFEIANQKQYDLFGIEVSKDKLKAYLRVNQQQKRRLLPIIIKDPSKIGDFIITTKEEKITGQNRVKIEEIYSKLEQLGIRYGLNEAAIRRAIENPGEKVLIAEGKAPVDCVDEKIEYLFKRRARKGRTGKLSGTYFRIRKD